VHICYIMYPHFGILYQEKSGNPAPFLSAEKWKLMLEIPELLFDKFLDPIHYEVEIK
jgi:hypothetical protein